MPEFCPETDILNLYIDGLFLLLILVSVVFISLSILFGLYEPREAVFAGQLIPENYYSYFPLGILTVIPQAYVLIVIQLSIFLAISGATVYMYYLTMFLIREFQLGSKKHYRTSESFRQPNNIVYLYRSVQILQEQALSFVGPFFTIFHLLLCVLPVFSNYALFRYWDLLKWLVKAPLLLAYFGCVMFWLFVLQVGKYLWIRGNKNFDSWSKVGFHTNKIEGKIMRKFQKSCRLILLRQGKVLVLGRMTQFVYVKIVIVYTCKALLTLKK